MAKFTEIFEDVTKKGVKIPSNLYLDTGLYPIIDQGQSAIAGYTNKADGLFFDVPAIIFGDHTRIFKYVEKPCFLGADGVKLLKAKKPNANYKYLYYALCNADIPNTGYNRHFKWLKEVDIPEYSVEEQEDIVLKLDKISHLIALRKRQLSKLDELVKSRFVEMFGDSMTNPMGWPMAKMGDYLKFLTSGSRGWAKYYSDDGELFITIKNVKDGKISIDNVQHVQPPTGAEAERTRVQEGDLLISITADLGRTGIVTRDIVNQGAYINQHLSCIRLDRKSVEPLFVALYLESSAGKAQFERKNQSAVKAGLNFAAIRSLQFPLPPLALQREFAAFVAKVDKLAFKAKASLEKLETLKKAMMQKYFG